MIVPVEHIEGALPRTHRVEIETKQAEAYRGALGLPEPEVHGRPVPAEDGSD